MEKDQEELLLIKAVANKDDQALTKLVRKYQPMISKIDRTYFLRGYDNHDWHQEAMLVCYLATLSYQPERGKFSSYLQRQYRNHVRSLLRAHLADRRRANIEAESLEGLTELGHQEILANNLEPFQKSITEISHDFHKHLSPTELMVFKFLLGLIDEEKVSRELTKKQIRSARSRLHRKFIDCLY